MTLFHLLPLIKGWAMRPIQMGDGVPKSYPLGYAVLTPGQELTIFSQRYETGWILGLGYAGNDCYLALRVLWDGFDSGWVDFNSQQTDPYNAAQWPAPDLGFNYLYCRPNPPSSEGVYESDIVSMYGPYPYKGYLRFQVKLLTDTTQAYALIYVGGRRIVIVDHKAFLKDLRKLYWGRWAPLVDMVSHVPVLKTFIRRFIDLKIPFEEKEKIEPRAMTR